MGGGWVGEARRGIVYGMARRVYKGCAMDEEHGEKWYNIASFKDLLRLPDI